ncbi:MAG TPA: hypothetical protein VMR88_01170 [Candidatus Polarisedimenticolaceae bacterium]|nr:hypothetical protein [Candidatus Polarisedimenticolaceae bacterium]
MSERPGHHFLQIPGPSPVGLSVAGVPHAPDGVAAARDCLIKTSRGTWVALS